MINRILHSWSFHVKFIKLAEGSFDNFIWNDHSCKILYLSKKKKEKKRLLYQKAPIKQTVLRLVWHFVACMHK